ncbi:MAG TPA: hypothetical protein VLH16_03900, partial [Bacteroidales bacterium]|nr:hypothetical protein [Bacteroidales bacterium]
ILQLANELKVVVCCDSDLIWAESLTEKVMPECKLFLQPEWSQRKSAIPIIVDYIKAYPRWTISLQSHKYMNIP